MGIIDTYTKYKLHLTFIQSINFLGIKPYWSLEKSSQVLSFGTFHYDKQNGKVWSSRIFRKKPRRTAVVRTIRLLILISFHPYIPSTLRKSRCKYSQNFFVVTLLQYTDGFLRYLLLQYEIVNKHLQSNMYFANPENYPKFGDSFSKHPTVLTSWKYLENLLPTYLSTGQTIQEADSLGC